MFDKKKNNPNKDTNTKFEEMETAEEFGDGAFIAGAAVGAGVAVAVVALT
jgi:hypothetical protein